MPTYERLPRFDRDYKALSAEPKEAFRQAVRKFVEDLEAGKGFRRSLRVKGIQRAEGVFELTWAKKGRATFGYGEPVREGEIHIVWRRLGTHDVFETP